MNPNHNESTDTTTAKKRKGSKKDSEDERSSKKKSKRSKAKTNAETPTASSEEDEARSALSPLFPLSPPTTPEENSIDFNDILTIGDIGLPPTSDSSLAIKGTKIDPPTWWSDSLTCDGIREILETGEQSLTMRNQSSMEQHHPWSEIKPEVDDAMATLDDFESIVSQSLTAMAFAM